MKILFIGPAPPFRGGISLFAMHLGNEYTQAGHEVHFLNFKQQYPKLLFPGKEQTDNSLPYDSGYNHRLLVPWLPYTWLKGIRKIKHLKPDLIILSWFLPFFAPVYWFILCFLKRYHKVIIAHNVAPHESWPLAKFLTRTTFAQANRIVVLSKATLNELRLLGSNRLWLKAVAGFHPIEAEAVPITHQQGRELLFFGLIKPYKGLDLLLQAMPLILQQCPEAKLHIAGEVYGNKQEYEAIIHSLQLQDHVIIDFRYIASTEIPEIFQRASLCILPYKTASQSGVIATAYSFGVPVLATDVGGLGEYVVPGQTGYLVPANDPKALAEAVIKHLKTQPNFSSSIREYIKHYSWQELARLVQSS